MKNIKPMLATLTHNHFSHENWIFERKFDGERAITYCKNGKVNIKSRNDKSLNNQYPELVEKLEDLSENDYIIDGEIVTFDGDVTSFSELQKRMHVDNPSDDLIENTPVYYYVFDIIYLDGEDLSNLELVERKKKLKALFDYDDPIRFTTHRNEDGEKYLKKACKDKWEGLIAKKRDSKYIHSRSKKWLKFKCSHGQEFVIGGFTKAHGERIGFGALLLGYYEGEKLKYAGKVGTGFDDDMLKEMTGRLEKLKRDKSQFDQKIDEKEVTFVKPKLMAEVGFTEWTDENKLRHPRFLGLRDDKDPKDVRKEA